MGVLLAEDHKVLVEAVRDFAQAELIEMDREWDRTETSCCAHFGPLYELGLLGLRIPEAYGGLECPTVPYAHILREIAACSPSVAVTLSVHNMVADIINRYACHELKTALLPELARPGNLSAFAISEANAGSDPASVETRAEKVAGGWRLSGSKMWVTNGLTGKWFVILARATEPVDTGEPCASTDDPQTEREPGAADPPRARYTRQTGPEVQVGDSGPAPSSLCMFVVDAESEGVTRRGIPGKMGIRGSETAEMILENVVVPDSRLLGDRGWGMRIALSALDGGRIGIASQAAGIGQACLELMADYARQREQFGRPIASFQAIQWMLAESKAELMASQLLIDKAAYLHDQRRPFTHAASMAKLYAGEAANRIAYRAVQVHGGYGYVNEFRVERLYRDARITTIYEGTSEVQRIVIARGLLRA